MASAGQDASQRQLNVHLTLLNGERSFGMSLAQRRTAFGDRYTVVSSVFANSPAARAGICKGYAVRYINEKPMGGLTVADVARNFRNVPQVNITLEIVASQVLPTTSATATFEEAATPKTQESSASTEQAAAPVAGFSTISSGRAIAAPGSALAVPTMASPKQPVLRLGAKPAAKALEHSGGVSPVVNSTSVPSADAKSRSCTTRTELVSKAVTSVLRLGPKPKPVLPEKAPEKEVAAPQVNLKPAAKSVSKEQSCTVAQSATPTSVQATEETKSVANGQMTQVTQTKSSRAPAKPAHVVTPTPSPPKATAQVTPTPPTPSVAQEKPVTVQAPLRVKAKVAPLAEDATSHYPARLPTPDKTSEARTIASERKVAAATDSGAGTPLEPLVSTVNQSARSSRPVPAIVVAPAEQTEPVHSTVPYPPEPLAVSVRRRKRPASMIVAPVPLDPAPVEAAAQAPAPKRSGKKRRPRKNPAMPKGRKGKSKAKRPPNPRLESDEDDDLMEGGKYSTNLPNDVITNAVFADNVCGYYPISSDSDESPTKAARRLSKGKRPGVTDRTRHSLTVDRLIGMGFTQEDAEASVQAIGDDPDACMLWIISRIEEKQFNEDINRASIQSEQSKRDEEQRVKKKEKETLAQAEKFMDLFPTSVIVSSDSTASYLKKFLQLTIDQVAGEMYIREVLSKLLKLESQTIRWYEKASKSYMLELAGRLDVVLQSHDVMNCCAHIASNNSNFQAEPCAFVRKVLEEVTALQKALFEMPTNQGGVPPVFLECDETTKFDLDDDGFEVIE
ncbi:hypothetical protein P3T76_010921 [Phytophthora citrophthora]|uniref:UBA domain-containing protein n=1 Tax=Phytophthora citrophthora TaxID=4793 RepID=A0AAD9GB86_9STRA|nr:hypothetical protein P3T76_010921 [Phytophthora citrophthora]